MAKMRAKVATAFLALQGYTLTVGPSVSGGDWYASFDNPNVALGGRQFSARAKTRDEAVERAAETCAAWWAGWRGPAS